MIGFRLVRHRQLECSRLWVRSQHHRAATGDGVSGVGLRQHLERQHGPPSKFLANRIRRSCRHGRVDGGGPCGLIPVDRAEHLGTTPAALETTDGLAAAMGSQSVHALSFAGPEMKALVNSGGNAINIEEAYSSTSPTTWVSHPSGIGYRRVSSGPQRQRRYQHWPGIPGTAPITDSGTTDGSSDQELARLVNFRAPDLRAN